MNRLLKRAVGLAVFTVFTIVAIFSSLVLAYANGEYGTGTYGSCSYDSACSISLTSDGNISLNITPAAGGRCTIQSDSAIVQTDDSNGYTLTLANNSTNTALVNGSDTIDAGSGTFSSPAALTANSWGYRIDGAGSFGSGPTTSQSNVAIGSATFAGIVASNQIADTIVNSSLPANPAVTTTVWFGACADTSAKSGTYTTQVLYTAVAN